MNIIKRLIVLASFALASVLAIANISAAAPDIAAGIQFIDHGCTGGMGQYSITAYANAITGAAASQWAADSNYYDPDCVRVTLQKSAAALTKDVRICVQVADSMSPNMFGVITNVDQVGDNRCSPWATDGGGWSGWAYDTNGDDPDGARLTLETRALPSGKQIDDLRLGIQTGDHKCDRRLSGVVYTPWTNDGGGWSGWASGGADPNCLRVELQSKLSQTASCTAPVPASGQPTINLSDIQYVNAVRSGATVCPSGRVFVGVDQQDHAGVIRLKCAASSNLLKLGATPDVPLTIDIIRGNWSASNNCPAGHIINGVVQDAEGRETAIRCQPVVAGSVDFNYAPGGVGTHGRSGDRYEVNFNENKGGEWVAFGAIYNKSPYSSRGIAGYQLKPRTNLPPAPAPCEIPAVDCVTGGRSLVYPLSLSAAAPVTQGTGGPVIGMECTGNKLIITVATEYANHKKIVAGMCGTASAGFFTSAQSSWVEASNGYNGTYSCPTGAVISRFAEGGILCRPIAGGASAFVPGTERTIALGAGTAVNNSVSLAQSGSNKIWAPIAVTYQGGVPAQKSVKVIEVRTAASCTEDPIVPVPPVTPGAPAGCSDGIDNDNDGATDSNDLLDCGSGGPGERTPAPTCTLTASPTTIVLNVGSSILTWSCSSGPVTISDNNPLFEDIVGTKDKTGSITVAPDQRTTFTVTAGGATASATVNVGGSIIDETGGL